MTNKTISEILASLTNRPLPKCPCTYIFYGKGDVVPMAVLSPAEIHSHIADAPLAESVVIFVVETAETIAFRNGAWCVVGATSEAFTAAILG